jgi:hypothetical protein
LDTFSFTEKLINEAFKKIFCRLGYVWASHISVYRLRTNKCTHLVYAWIWVTEQVLCLKTEFRVARFFSVQHTKMGRNIPNDHKMYKMAIKIPFDHKIHRQSGHKKLSTSSITRPSHISPNWNFLFENNHLAIPTEIPYVCYDPF